jgi:5,10-methylene-tetrahydrofolate dehydrogenase/methenyl tetrahydrofolate cyclohydrolase
MTHDSLPKVVDQYFAQMDGDDKLAVADLFAPGAYVIDNGTTYRGDGEIRGWLSGEASEFTTTSRRLMTDSAGSSVMVVLRVEGNFPGGMVDLTIEFLLDSTERIRGLTITA